MNSFCKILVELRTSILIQYKGVQKTLTIRLLHIYVLKPPGKTTTGLMFMIQNL
jgi:hypothetical protein